MEECTELQANYASDNRRVQYFVENRCNILNFAEMLDSFSHILHLMPNDGRKLILIFKN